MEFLEAHFGDVEFVDPNQQGDDADMDGKAESKAQVDVESKEQQADSKNQNTDMEDDKDAQEEEDTKMDNTEDAMPDKDDQEPSKARSGRDYRDVPFGPHLLVKLDRHEARVAVPAMVSSRFNLFFYIFSNLRSRYKTVMCKHEPLRRRVNAVLEMAIATIDTLADSYEVTRDTTNQPAVETKEETKEMVVDPVA